MIDRTHELPLARQAALLRLSRSQLYYEPRPVPAAELALMRRIDALHLDYPFAGSRMLRDLLRGEGVVIGRDLVRTMMRRMCIEALYRRPNTSRPAPGHKIYPYLLGGLAVERPNQVWTMDITYIPMARGFVYLAAVMDWSTRGVLAWRLSITMEVDFCIEAVEEALATYGRPEIFNTDQGSQGGFKWSSQHPLKGSCDAKSKAAVGTGAAVLTWSPTGDRTRREPAVLGGDCGRYGE
jgi:putative transposase